MTKSLGEKALEWETLLGNTIKTVADNILLNCHFCKDTKVIVKVIKNDITGLEVSKEFPCPNCNKEKK